MEKIWCYFFFLIWFSYLLVAQVLLFTNGFLLTRVAQFKNSTCVLQEDDFCISDSDVQCKRPYNPLDRVEYVNICLLPRAKVILLIIDALRYDFTIYNESLVNPLPYQNKLPVISELNAAYPESSRLYKFIADPPTTTMQRLKGLTTGSLPTFVEAGSNFATHEINEDNLIDQVNNRGYSTIFLGDDTWNGLYPNRFKRNFPFPSFNVWDLDTVDLGIRNNIYKEIKMNDWHLMIAHFLGVDHAGHRYGPDHPEMARKLTEVNTVIKKVVDDMDDNTMLFVVGDHGMTSTGDHGGESESEITAAMFVYSKMNLVLPYLNHNNTIKQVDLVPTLSTILGIPIPYSNLGAVVYDALPMAKNHNANWQNSLLAGWSNVKQLTKYIKEYSEQSPDTFNHEKLRDLQDRFNLLKAKLALVKSESDFENFAFYIHEHIKVIRDMCEEVWIQFDAYSMARGLLLISFITIFMFLIIDGLSSNVLESLLTEKFIYLCYGTVIVSFTFGLIVLYLKLVTDMFNTVYFVSGLFAICILSVTVVKNFQGISMNLYENSKSRKWTDILCRAILCFSAVMLFANSFIMEEAKIMFFFSLTLIFIVVLEFALLKLGKTKEVSMKFLLKNKWMILTLFICVLMRFSIYFWRCREEQACDNSGFSKISYSGQIEWVMTAVTLFVFILLSRVWLRACGNLNGFSATVILARYMPTISAICVVGFWVLHRLPKDTKTQLLGPWQPDMLAWVVYILSSLGIISVYIQPLAIFQLSNKNEVEVDKSTSNFIPQLAKHVFSNQNKRDKTPKVYGLATVYSAAFVIVSINLILLWALVLGDVAVPSCIALIFVATFILVLTVILQYERAQNIGSLLEIPCTSLLTWFIMSIYLFYGTGHQPAFPNIAWEAAFVGTGGNFKINFVPAFLVILNTFGSSIIMGITLPLLAIVPFSLFVMFPSLTSKRGKIDLSRGDLVLYDHNEMVTYTIFKLYCRYIMCHAVRVFCSMLAATIHCRHLMVWNVFAPKLIFEAIGLFVTLGSVLFGFFLFIRVNTKLDRFIKYLNKQFS